jgi:SAM-dependent methyltransferase
MLWNRWLEENKEDIKRFLKWIGYDYRHWARSAMYDACLPRIRDLNPSELDALEISSGSYDYWQKLGFKSFTTTQYPDFDICKDRLDRQFDLIIADQVFEHLLFPYRAAQNVCAMLKLRGYFLISTPFLIRVHQEPHDCTRWTETGIKYFLSESGFPLEHIQTGSWGNRACVKANFNKWVRRGWGTLQNEPDFPVTVWAIARKESVSES